MGWLGYNITVSVVGQERSAWIKDDMLDATDHPNVNETTRDDPERVALIERSLLVLLVIVLFVGVIAVLKPHPAGQD